ncbi:class I SAM-dependent methyltransferase [Streptomyces spectabilis]|uniref:SAM-dependent methyltransferase n=1 Tax=Streptomyces spectabilis TaxID=68270 RepID=A0A7W8B3W4_STRST|nr:class I SAM-dependent methyltransferase [Streptomyces spectabilis]MBB5109894.1 SAM-dependent methyltransferase [Streptomyces spectabilis]
MPNELRRLRLIEQVLDPDSVMLLRECQIQPSWHCLELGAGAGSIAYWLARQCPSGQVSAVDLDTRFLDPNSFANLAVHAHDVLDCDFPAESFNLIHTRALLVHVPRREELLRKAVEWLAPGGWLVAEEPVVIGDGDSPYPAFRALISAMKTLLARHGADLLWPRRMPIVARANGLTDLSVSTRTLPCGQGGAGDRLWRAMFEQLGPALISHGLLSQTQWQEGIGLFDDPSFVEISLTMLTTRACRSA